MGAMALTAPSQNRVTNRAGGIGTAGVPNVYIEAGGTSISHSAGNRPVSVRNFSYKRTIDNAANRMSVTMFDRAEEFIENELIANRTDISFSYGYSEGPMTSRIPGIVMDYTPVLMVGGTEINLDVLSVFGAERVKSRVHKGLISDIVRNIANGNGWRYEIDKTKKIPSQGSLEGTEPDHMQFQQTDQSDMSFIKNVLVPKAVRDSDSVGGYVVYFDDLSNTLHFHPPRLDAKIFREYVWRGNAREHQQVIRFAPSLQGKILGLLGLQGVATQGEDPTTGETSAVTVDRDSTATSRQSLGTSVGDLGPVNTSGIIEPSASGAAAQAISEARWYAMFNHTYSAELTVIGDPFIPVGSLINVWVFLKSGKPHYSSGTYLVLGAQDEIQGGSFRTTLSLAKNAIRQGEPAGGQRTGR